MTGTKILVPTSFALALLAGAAFAQTGASAPANASPNSASMTPMQVANGEQSPNAVTFNPNPMTVTAQTAPPAQIQALAAGSNKLVTNGPIPDTPANRKLYGKPLSHAGRKSAPDGN
jgi:hypothetical protein